MVIAGKRSTSQRHEAEMPPVSREESHGEESRPTAIGVLAPNESSRHRVNAKKLRRLMQEHDLHPSGPRIPSRPNDHDTRLSGPRQDMKGVAPIIWCADISVPQQAA